MLETVKTSPQPAPDPAAHLAARLRELRAGRNWSLEALSRASGVSRSMLSQIERNRVNPTLAVTLSIARAFGLSIGEFLEMPSASPTLHVIRKNDREYHYRSDKDCSIRTLSPLNLEKDVEFYEVTLEPKGALRSAPHYPGTREFLTVQKGRVRVESGPDSEVLSAGDSVSYRADLPHLIANAGSHPAVLFLVDIYLD
ncbi:MAG: helix-turn-helix transcriptional regulator [Acidobacteria bacterium]|nr:helix-turn-helix transcriptional regulator [Acidobacteriota bacterium]